MPNSIPNLGDIRFAVSKTDWSSIIHHTIEAVLPFQIWLLLLTASTSVSSKKTNVLQKEIYFKQSTIRGIETVDREGGLFYWVTSSSRVSCISIENGWKWSV